MLITFGSLFIVIALLVIATGIATMYSGDL